MAMTLSEATDLTGKSKSTLNRAIKSGDLSAKRSDDGKTYEVEKSELERVYGPFDANLGSSEVNQVTNHGSPDVANLRVEWLEQRSEEIKLAHRREVELLKTQLDDLRQERDDWKTQASNQTLLLKHEQERTQTPEPKKRFSLFG